MLLRHAGSHASACISTTEGLSWLRACSPSVSTPPCKARRRARPQTSARQHARRNFSLHRSVLLLSAVGQQEALLTTFFAQVRPNAASRLAALPLVASVRTKLSVVYTGTKRSHPRLGSVCDGLESGVTALLSPVIGKLEPHISIANEVACQSLDWLEAAFPMLHTPTEQLVATATKKMAEIQDVVSVAANGSAACVSLGVAWLMVRLEAAQNRGLPLLDGAVAAAAVGLEVVLSTSEALVDQMLPPVEHDKEKLQMVQSSEGTLQRSYRERLFALAAKLYQMLLNCRVHLIQIILKLPQNLQYQLVSAVIFLSQSRNRPTNKSPRLREPIRLHAPDIRYVDSQTTLPTCRLRTPVSENVCSVQGCVDR